MNDALHIALPEFLVKINEAGVQRETPQSQMAFVIDLARRNMEAGGGPFAAAVFESAGGRLVAAGVNRVIASHCSSAHAEILALALAQQRIGDYDLGAAHQPAHVLVTSVEPCVMCLGAVIWSGVRSVVCGARDGDARAVGFDEGPKPPAWVDELENRGIQVVRDLMRPEAVEVLHDYAARGGFVYNARCG